MTGLFERTPQLVFRRDEGTFALRATARVAPTGANHSAGPFSKSSPTTPQSADADSSPYTGELWRGALFWRGEKGALRQSLPFQGEVARPRGRDGEVFAAASLGRTCRGDPCGRPFPHSARSRRATARVAPTTSQSAPPTAPLAQGSYSEAAFRNRRVADDTP